jgi:indoleamine 2,3-dioxygenase
MPASTTPSLSRGFLPAEDPLPRLPARFEEWEAVAADLPALVAARRVRRAVDALPPFDAGALSSEREFARAKVLLAHVSNCYVWTEAPVIDRLPARLAVPWHAVAVRLGMPPMLTYSDWALHKWRRYDSSETASVGNLALTLSCGGSVDEAWFVLVHVSIEALAAPGLAALPHMQAAAAREDEDALVESCAALWTSLQAMRAMLLRMYEHCDPYVYFHRVRPFMFGWRNNPALPAGMIYEGVAEYGGRPMQFYGETGAQSTVIPSVDAALGIAHEHDEMREYLRAMLDYAPPAHRAFVESLAAGPSVRAYVRHCAAPKLIEAYDACIDSVEQFRSLHMQLAADYIFKQNREAALGTGGTSFMTYLGKHRSETHSARLAGE